MEITSIPYSTKKRKAIPPLCQHEYPPNNTKLFNLFLQKWSYSLYSSTMANYI